MNHKLACPRFLAVGASVLTLLLPVSVFAQSTAPKSEPEKDEKAVELERYVVDTSLDRGYRSKNTLSTAGRISTRLLDTPQTIQILNQELITDLNADQMLGAVQMVSPGIARRSFNPGDDQFISGFRSSASLKDGIGLGSNATGPMYDVDRVEVLKGPIAMTFGNAGFVGGAINYVTRKPGKKPTTEVTGTIGNFNYFRGEVHLSRPVTETFRYRLDLGATDSDYSDRRYSYYKDQFVGGGAVWDISDRTKLTVDTAFSKINYNRALTFIDPTTFKVFNAPDSFSYDTKQSEYPTENFRATAALATNLRPGFNFQLFVGYINFHNDWYRPYATDYNPTTGILKRVSESFLHRNSSFITNLDFSNDFTTGPLKHAVVWGAANTFSRSSDLNESFATTPLDVRNPGDGGSVSSTPRTGEPAYGAYGARRSRTSSAFLQDTISFLDDRGYVIAGLRFNNSQSENKYAAAAPATFNKTVFRYGALFKVTPGTSVYVNHSEAFIFNSGVDFRQRPLVPSVGNHDEIGVKAELAEGRFSVTAAYFDIELTNVRLLFVQGPNDPQPGSQGVFQGGTQTNKGYELTAAVNQPLGDGEVNAIATFYTGNVLNELKIKPVGPTNNTTSLLLKYGFSKGSLKGLSFGAGTNFIGERLASRISQIPNSRFVQLPKYTVYNLFGSYTHGRTTYRLTVDNLTDEKFIQGAELPFWIFTDPGLMTKFSVTYRF